MKKINCFSRKKIGKKLLITGIVFVTAALSLFVYNKIMDFSAGKFTSSVMSELKDYIDSEQQSELNSDNNIENNHFPSNNSSKWVKNYNFIGYISIPKINLELPVISDWDYDKLNVSPCRYTGSVSTGNFVIAAHNYYNHFGNIYKLEKGDEVIFTDLDGKSYLYEVVLTDTLNSVEINKMISEEYDLSLFTCTWSGRARITVRCNKNF